MKRIRKSLVVISVVLALAIPFGSVASADPGTHTRIVPTTTSSSDGDPGCGGCP